jgi:6-phosphogluconolactonase
MHTPLLRCFADVETLSHAAAMEFAQRAMEATAARHFTVALSGGHTPKRLYELLAAAPYRLQVDWSRVEVFWGDERPVPADDPQSNYRMANAALLQHVPISAKQVHRMPAERPDRDVAAAEYEAEIARVFGVPAMGSPPAFDLILLGMGPDAHTASLFPETAALKEAKRWVLPNYVPKMNTYRMTFSVPLINQARCVFFLVAGADKAVPLGEVLEGPRDPERLPSQLIQPVHGPAMWFVDVAAAAQLQQRPKVEA